jgi:RNA polymerase sigma factor (sigma-70 family)
MSTTQAGVVLRHIRGLTVAGTAAQMTDRQLLERFTAARDQAAFETLVRRHGPLVWGVCRRYLREAHDVEDAFPATFCALAQKARSIRRLESVGGWLYQVACNAARKARSRAATRSLHERQAGDRLTADPLDELTGRELLAALDEELRRLPERCRVPLVLCYLEGKTRDEAARELGWTLGTLKRRLEQGRACLRARLERRGLAFSALLGAGVVAAAVPAGLAASTARVALLAAVTPTSLPQLVASAVAGAGRKVMASALLVVAFLAVGTGLMLLPSAGPDAPPPRDDGEAPEVVRKTEVAPAPQAEEKKEQRITGRVLDPDGKPAAGAKVFYLRSPAPGSSAAPARQADRAVPAFEASTDQDGRFSFTAPADGGRLFVTAPGRGPAWVLKPGRLEDNPLRLARDDVAVTGRVLDLQGQPVPGAVVRVHALKAPSEGTLERWLEAIKVNRDGMQTESTHLGMFAHGDLPHFFPPVMTDSAGRFQIKGIGRERVASLIIEAPTIETREVNVVTRPGFTAANVRRFTDPPGDERLIYYPPVFDYSAGPGRVVSGVVRDKLTRKPVAGAVVRLSENVLIANPLYFIKATTDPEGKYRLSGLPRKLRELRRNEIVVLPPEGEPYLALSRGLAESDTRPEVLDFDLSRGVWLGGQVKDKVTGRGVPSRLGYFVFGDGSNDPELRSLYIPPMAGMALRTDRDGRFRIVAAPHRGMIAARAQEDGKDHYRIGIGADRIEGGQKNAEGFLFGHTFPHTAYSGDFETLAEVKPTPGAETIRCDLVLDPGRTVTVQVRMPDGKPLAGTRAHGQLARAWWSEDQLPAEFNVYGLDPGRSRTVLLRHEGKNLVARCEIAREERGPVVATLQPAAGLTGRVLDDDGRPVAEASIMLLVRADKEGALELDRRSIATDADGRFRIDGLLPGLIYSARVRAPDRPLRQSLFDGVTLGPGESKDLGTVRPKKLGQ